VNTSVPHSIEEVPMTAGRDIFASEETVPFNAVETRSRKKTYISSMTCQMISVSKLTVNKYSRTSHIS
jgi:hypothetical protein